MQQRGGHQQLLIAAFGITQDADVVPDPHQVRTIMRTVTLGDQCMGQQQAGEVLEGREGCGH